MKHFLSGVLSAFLLVSNTFAEPLPAEKVQTGEPADFDYMYIKINGRVTVVEGVAMFHLTGKDAKAIYYHMQAKPEKNSACTAGMTKQLPGLICTQYFTQKKENFECHIGIDLKNGKLDSSPYEEACPESDEEEVASIKYWDALDNKQLRGED
ncbi:MAG: hypothetical protein LBU53_10015 [Zoogloeaceae bacterium]|jgi:hypothetical protein|nr:hypothetical protein [Zoogloeaceae bacterium]